MVILQKRSQRKATGGRYVKLKVRRKAQKGSLPTFTKLDSKRKLKRVRVRGGNTKFRLYTDYEINLFDKENKKCQKGKILKVESCPANRNYVRRNILVKGTTVNTDKGKAVITNRPGQEGTINGVLVAESA